jgi:hypothetical protein
MQKLLLLTLVAPVPLLPACGDRPADLSAPARKACEDQLSQKLGGFPGFPADDPRNERKPIKVEESEALGFRLRGVVEADGIRGIYDCEVTSPDSGRSWQVIDLRFNLLERPEPVP